MSGLGFRQTIAALREKQCRAAASSPPRRPLSQWAEGSGAPRRRIPRSHGTASARRWPPPPGSRCSRVRAWKTRFLHQPPRARNPNPPLTRTRVPRRTDRRGRTSPEGRSCAASAARVPRCSRTPRFRPRSAPAGSGHRLRRAGHAAARYVAWRNWDAPINSVANWIQRPRSTNGISPAPRSGAAAHSAEAVLQDAALDLRIF